MKWTAALVVVSLATAARAYTVSTPVTAGCHEAISAAALRHVRDELPTAGPIAPSRDDQAMIDDAPFVIDEDLRDLAGATLLFAVRDNDLKGNDPLDTFDVVPLAADPALQREHCLRAPDEDEPDGTMRAVADCAAFIHDKAADAIAGLDGAGMPDAGDRVHLEVALALRGAHVGVELPRYWVRIAQAMHALEDGFTHNLRSEDGMRITAVLNWSDYVDGALVEGRDGPAHERALDVCDDPDAARTRRHQLAINAATELLRATLDPALDAGGKLARVDALVAQSLAVEAGCGEAGEWCDPGEYALRDAGGCGCRIGGGTGNRKPETGNRKPGEGAAIVVVALVVIALLRRRHVAVVIVLVAMTAVARGQAVPGEGQQEPGREVETPTMAHVQRMREYKRLGPRVGFYTAVAGSFDRGALATTLALRVRVTERWIVGFDSEWNPWITASVARAGAINLAFTGIRRWPLTWERVNLRSTLQLGMSVLLFDVFGAPGGSVGLYVATAPLGIDVDLRRGCRLVVDPLGVAIPVPHLTGEPFYYMQYRISIGFQFGG